MSSLYSSPATADQPPAEAADESSTAVGRRPPGAGAWALRAALALGALALGAAALVAGEGERADRRELLERYRPHAGELPPEVGSRLRGEPDLDRARIALARALVATELDPEARARRTTGDAEADLAGSLARLDLARQAAAEALGRRPASWQAAMLLGAATYLARSTARDPALIRDWEAWDRPLVLARERAPQLDEPSRFAVLAYLELWPVLSEAKRDETRAMVRRALADVRFFGHLIGPWMAIAGDPEEVFAVTPPAAHAWDYLLRRYAADHDWESARRAYLAWEDALEGELGATLAEARRHRDGGDASGARGLYLKVLRDAPPRDRFLPSAAAALDEMPPGPASPSYNAPFERWLDWCLELCAIGRCPLPEPALDRLAGMIDGLPPARAAFAAVYAGRLTDGERLERRAAELDDPAWDEYFIAKARELARRGHRHEARQALARVGTAWHRRQPYRLAAAEVDGGSGVAGDGSGGEGAEDGRRSTASWLPGTPPELELALGAPAAGLEIGFERVPSHGALVEVRLDGRRIGLEPVEPGAALRLEAPVEPGGHLLTLRWFGSSKVVPGPVRPLVAAAGAAAEPPPPPRTPPPG